VAGHAFNGHVTAGQREASLGMIETRSPLLRHCWNRNGDQNRDTDAAEPSKSVHVSPRAVQLWLKREPNAPRRENEQAPQIIQAAEFSLRISNVLPQDIAGATRMPPMVALLF
jgi:hypothetical protein